MELSAKKTMSVEGTRTNDIAPRLSYSLPHMPSASERRRLSEAGFGVSDTSIARAYSNPNGVRAVTLLRVQRAALELGLPVPGAL